MSHDPTPTQALLIFGLLGRHGECAQAELMPAVKKADREALSKAKLVSSGKVGRGLRLTLEDAGWAWAAAHLSAELPQAHRTLSDMLTRLDAHLTKHRETLAEFIGSKPASAVPPQTVKAPAKNRAAGRKSTQTKSSTPAALRKRIEKAYLQITDGRKNESVRLSRLRAGLSDLDRATVDAALGRILAGDKKATLMRHDDPRQISDADRASEFNPAGEPFHVLWIAS